VKYYSLVGSIFVFFFFFGQFFSFSRRNGFSQGEIEWQANDKTQANDASLVEGTFMGINSGDLRQFK
jgi:hypothetical protein